MGLFGGSSADSAGFDSSKFRGEFSKLVSQYRDLYDKRMPVLENYEKMSQQSLSDLIGQTAPQAQRLFQYANNLMDASQQNLKSAQGYDTKERRSSERGKAMVDVQQGADAARQQALDRLESYGIDPSQTRSASLDSGLQLAKTLEQVRAATDAETGVEERGRAYTNDALRTDAGALGVASGASGQGADMLSNNVQQTNSTAALYGQIFGTPTSNLAAQGDLQQRKLDAKIAEAQSQAAAGGGGGGMGGIGSLVGMGLGAWAGSYAGPGGAMQGAKLGGALGGQLGGSV